MQLSTVQQTEQFPSPEYGTLLFQSACQSIRGLLLCLPTLLLGCDSQEGFLCHFCTQLLEKSLPCGKSPKLCITRIQYQNKK